MSNPNWQLTDIFPAGAIALMAAGLRYTLPGGSRTVGDLLRGSLVSAAGGIGTAAFLQSSTASIGVKGAVIGVVAYMADEIVSSIWTLVKQAINPPTT